MDLQVFRNCAEITCTDCVGYFFESACQVGEIDKSR